MKAQVNQKLNICVWIDRKIERTILAVAIMETKPLMHSTYSVVQAVIGGVRLSQLKCFILFHLSPHTQTLGITDLSTKPLEQKSYRNKNVSWISVLCSTNDLPFPAICLV